MQDDSLRFAMISLYEYDFRVLQKLKEYYHEMQFHASHSEEITSLLSPYFLFAESGALHALRTPVSLSQTQRNSFLTILPKIQSNREFILRYYPDIETKIADTDTRISRFIQ